MLELIINHSPDKIRIRLKNDDVLQECEVAFSFQESKQELDLINWYFEQYHIYPYGPFQNRAVAAETAMKTMGERIFASIFSEGPAQRIYEQVEQNLSNCRIVVEGSGTESWEVPWELIRDPQRDIWLALEVHSFSRRQSSARRASKPEPMSLATLNVLLIICRPFGYRDIPFRSLARPLLEVFRPFRDRINLDILRPPTFAELSKTLLARPNFYHIVHFDGHGVLQRESTKSEDSQIGQGWLVFEAQDGESPQFVSGAEFGSLLARTEVPIALLDACYSGATPPKATLGSIGQQLLAAGVPGVVTMNYSVLASTASQFMAEVYSALLNGESLGRAVAVGRRRLWADPDRRTVYGNIPLQDWIIPAVFEDAPVQLTEAAKDKMILPNIRISGELPKAQVEVDMPLDPAYGFVGRDWELLQLERAVETEAIVLLQGFAGSGKTAMAVAFARWWAETGGLEGPALFFSFANYLPIERVYERIGDTFEEVLRAQGIEWWLISQDQRSQLAVQILRQIPCLLILDHFEPIAGFPPGTESAWTDEEQVGIKDFLHELRGGATKVIITSRRAETWLGNIYRVIELGGLNLNDAREFTRVILERKGQYLPERSIQSTDEDPYEQLLRYLRGNPLALQLIVPKLTGSDPAAILKELQALETLLPVDVEKEGRDFSLSATVGYGLDQLDPELKQRLSLLALFQVSVNSQVLSILCTGIDVPTELQGRPLEVWTADLEEAATIGLLRRITMGAYEIHPALPWVFQSSLQKYYAASIPNLVDAYMQAYATVGETGSKQFQIDPQQAMLILQLEEANLRHALHLARTANRWESVQGILYGLRTLLTTLGRWSEWVALLTEVKVNLVEREGKPQRERERLWSAVQGHLGEMAMLYGDLDTSEAIYNRLKLFYEDQHDEQNIAVAMHQLGRIAQERRRYDEAINWFEQSLEIAVKMENLQLMTIALQNLGTIAQELRQSEKAETYYRRSLEIAERVNDQSSVGNTLHQLGIIAQERGQFEEAQAWYQQSLEIAGRSGNQYGIARTLHQLGIISQERGQYDEAEMYCRRSLEIAEQLGDQQGVAATLHNIGVVAQERGRLKEAEEWYRRSLAIKEQLDNKAGVARALHQLGRVAQQQEHYDEAEAWYRQSLGLAERLGEQYGIARTLHQLGIIYQEREQYNEAQAYYLRSLEIAERLDDKRGVASTLHQLGVIAQKQGLIEEAEGQYRQSLRITEQVGDRQGQAITILQLATVAHTEERRNEAEVLFRRAEAIFTDLNNQPAVEFVRQQLLLLDKGEMGWMV